MDKIIKFRLDDDLYKKAEWLADKKKLFISELMRELISDSYDNDGGYLTLVHGNNGFMSVVNKKDIRDGLRFESDIMLLNVEGRDLKALSSQGLGAWLSESVKTHRQNSIILRKNLIYDEEHIDTLVNKYSIILNMENKKFSDPCNLKGFYVEFVEYIQGNDDFKSREIINNRMEVIKKEDVVYSLMIKDPVEDIPSGNWRTFKSIYTNESIYFYYSYDVVKLDRHHSYYGFCDNIKYNAYYDMKNVSGKLTPYKNKK